MDEAQAVFTGPGEGPTVQGPVGGPLTFKARGEQTGGRLLALENVVAPGQGPPVHTHDHEDEAWYVVEGELDFRLGDEERTAPAGSFVFVPRGMPHAFRNAGSADARILVLFTPAGMERFFDAMGELGPGPAEPAAFGRLGAPAGMSVVGPPLG